MGDSTISTFITDNTSVQDVKTGSETTSTVQVQAGTVPSPTGGDAQPAVKLESTPLKGSTYSGLDAQTEAAAEGALAQDDFFIPAKDKKTTQLVKDFFADRQYKDYKQGHADIAQLAATGEAVNLSDGRKMTLAQVDDTHYGIGTVTGTDGTITMRELKGKKFKEKVIESPGGGTLPPEYKNVPSTVAADQAQAASGQTLNDVKVVPADPKVSGSKAHLVYNGHDSYPTNDKPVLDGDLSGFTLLKNFNQLTPSEQEIAMRGALTVTGRAMGLGDNQKTTNNTSLNTEHTDQLNPDLGLAAYVRDNMAGYPGNEQAILDGAKKDYADWQKFNGPVADGATSSSPSDPVAMYRDSKAYMLYRSYGANPSEANTTEFNAAYKSRFESGLASERPSTQQLWETALGRKGDGTDLKTKDEYKNGLFNSPPPTEKPELLSDATIDAKSKASQNIQNTFPTEDERARAYAAVNANLDEKFDKPMAGLRQHEAEVSANIQALTISAGNEQAAEKRAAMTKQIAANGKELADTRKLMKSLATLRQESVNGNKFDMQYTPGNLENSAGIDPTTGAPRFVASEDAVARAKANAETDKVPLNAAQKFYHGFSKGLKNFTDEVGKFTPLVTMGTGIGTLATTLHNFNQVQEAHMLDELKEVHAQRELAAKRNDEYVQNMIMKPYAEMFKNQEKIWDDMRTGADRGSLRNRLKESREKFTELFRGDENRQTMANPQRTADNDEEVRKAQERQKIAAAQKQEQQAYKYPS